jgi:hypothetical protein
MVMGSTIDSNEYFSGLEKLDSGSYLTYHSAGARERAEYLSAMAGKGYSFLKEFFKQDFEMPLMVLNKEDWLKRTSIYDYGAIFAGNGCVHFPADVDHTFLDLVQPLYDSSPEQLQKRLIEMVGEETPFRKGFGIFLDSKIVHEFTHVSLYNKGIYFGLRWFNEFFCDYTNYAFLKRYESDYRFRVKLHEFMPYIMYEGGFPHAKYQRSMDFEKFYYDILRVRPLNFIWFYGRNMLGVIELYRVYGEEFIRYVLDAFTPSNRLLVQKLGCRNNRVGEWFKEWLEKNP